ncbi:FecCD family ABC transporter permease [Shouchella rhizosphaerae]|uniref:FecCD family ABC transporter permease n=1 Tax=Shouchella rhizosphaerae TaxID=866786 RepID=UPI003F7FC6F8
MRLSNRISKIIGILVGLLLLAALFAASNTLGYTDTTWRTVYKAYWQFNGSNEHLIIRDLRLPRALTAILVGAALAVSGAVMQALTRNKLASPGVLGVNAGAVFFVVIGLTAGWAGTQSELIWLAFVGAAVSLVCVLIISSIGAEGITPFKLTLAGLTIGALFSSFSSALLVSSERALESVLFWMAGSVEGRNLKQVLAVMPFLAGGLGVSFFLGRPLNVAVVGDDMAKGLGQNTLLLKLWALLLTALLAGSSVAIAGPIGFVGLVIPHIARWLVGLDYRWILPYCALLGGTLLCAADIGARFIVFPKEVPVGVMTALIGAPFFIYLARREIRHQ